MKKIIILVSMILLMLLLAIPTMAYDEMNVDIVDVQTVNIQLVYEKGSLSDDILTALPKDFSVTESSQNTYINFTVSNLNIADNLTKKFDALLTLFHENGLSEDVDIDNISFISSFDGSPFNATIFLNASGLIPDKKINLHINGTASVNDGDYLPDIEITRDMFPINVSYSVNTADSLEVIVTPNEDCVKVDVQYILTKENGPYTQMSEGEYVSRGFNVVSLKNDKIVLSKTFNSIDDFNRFFEIELLYVFNVVSTIKIDSHKSISKGIGILGKVSRSECIKNATITFVLPQTATDSESGVVGKSFKYDLNSPFVFNISFNTANTSSIIIVLVVLLGFLFVGGCFYLLGKKGYFKYLK